MGYLSAKAMSEEADLETALRWHLSSNHYPPMPPSLVPVAKKAVESARRGDWERLIPLPDGITWRGHPSVSAYDAVESMHLDAFLD